MQHCSPALRSVVLLYTWLCVDSFFYSARVLWFAPSGFGVSCWRQVHPQVLFEGKNRESAIVRHEEGDAPQGVPWDDRSVQVPTLRVSCGKERKNPRWQGSDLEKWANYSMFYEIFLILVITHNRPSTKQVFLTKSIHSPFAISSHWFFCKAKVSNFAFELSSDKKYLLMCFSALVKTLVVHRQPLKRGREARIDFHSTNSQNITTATMFIAVSQNSSTGVGQCPDMLVCRSAYLQ